MSEKAVTKTTDIRIDSKVYGIPIHLTKLESLWYVILDDNNRYRARQSRITAFLKILSDQYVARAIEYGKLGNTTLKSDESVSIQLFDTKGQSLARFVLGKVTLNGLFRYIGSDHESRHYLIDDVFYPYLDSRIASWVDLDLFSDLDTAGIQKLTVKRNDSTRIFWAGQNRELELFEGALIETRALDITNIPFVPSETMTIETGNLQVFSLDFFPLNESSVLFTDSRTGNSYVMSHWAKQKLDESLIEQ